MISIKSVCQITKICSVLSSLLNHTFRFLKYSLMTPKCIYTLTNSEHAYGCLLQRKVVLDDRTLRVPDETFLNIGLCY